MAFHSTEKKVNSSLPFLFPVSGKGTDMGMGKNLHWKINFYCKNTPGLVLAHSKDFVGQNFIALSIDAVAITFLISGRVPKKGVKVWSFTHQGEGVAEGKKNHTAFLEKYFFSVSM